MTDCAESQSPMEEGQGQPPSGAPPPLHSNMRSLVDAYSNAQKNRIMWGNRVSALTRAVDQQEAPQLLQAQRYSDMFQAIEEQAFKELKTELDTHPVWPWLKRVKGVGPTLAGKVLCDIDIRKAETVGKLWAFAGMSVKDSIIIDGQPVGGHSPKPVKGEKLPYSAKLRTALFNVGRSMLMSNSPYKSIYTEAKLFYTENRMTDQKITGTGADGQPAEFERKAWTKAHVDFAARRRMIKIFLQHLWLKWREAEGLPVDEPYVIKHQPQRGVVHTHILRPDEFVEPVKQ